jgi:predicted MFS family arabinose efflux permease
LFILGFANGAWDVAMNVQGAAVERRLGRSIMPRFHAGFSLGTVAGALIGAAAVALHVPVTAHLVGVAIVVAAAVPTSVRRFVPDHGDGDTELTDRDSEADLGAEETAPQQAHRGGHRRTLAAWREPRTLLIGIFVLAFAFAEGTGNDWISVALIDGQHVPAAVGTLGFAAFLAAMTTGRWFGPGLLDRHGRVAVVRGLALLGIAGTALFVFAPVAALGFVGALLWGLGASLGFPVGMSAGADDPKLAAGRVSVIASIGYCAFLGGPPTIGFLGDRFTVLHALAAVSVLLALATLVSTAVAPAGQARSGRSRTRR